MKKIALIGCGQLGSRYLQGLAKLNFEIDLEIVEPFEKSIEMAKSRFNEVENKAIKNIKWLKNIEELSNEFDLIIVATTADVRANIVKSIIKNISVSNLLLEKVLFQKMEDFFEIECLLKENNINCWVNHPRRIYPFYQKLKEKLKNKKIFLEFKGSNWGLACNGLHFIDLLAYLTDSNNLEVDIKYLHKRIYDTKRSGFKEVNGLLVGKINDNVFSLFSSNYDIPAELEIIANEYVYKINEAKGEYSVWDGKEWKTFEEKIVYFQSELTPITIENIFKNDCKLPTYEEAMKLHLPFIDNLTKHFKDFSNFNYCPIT